MGRLSYMIQRVTVFLFCISVGISQSRVHVNSIVYSSGKWLDGKDVEYFTENDLRAGTVEGKTPDFLLMEPIEWHGDQYNWIESKASFGDEYIHRKNHRGQVSKYVELYGQGILVYWYAYLDNLKSRGYTII